jgi:hypothetical protein
LFCVQVALKDEAEKKGKVPIMKDILKLRFDGDKSELSEDYMYFCGRFLKCVVGVQAFNRGMRMKTLLSDIATPSDEALALLLLENSHYRWNEEHDKKSRSNEPVKEDDLPPPKYTNAGNKKLQKGFTKKYGGWTGAGIDRYNELYGLVLQDRSAHGAAFDEFVMGRWNKAEDTNAQDQDRGAGHRNIAVAANDLFMDFGGGFHHGGGGGVNDDDDDDYNNRMGLDRDNSWEPSNHHGGFEDDHGEDGGDFEDDNEIGEQQSV